MNFITKVSASILLVFITANFAVAQKNNSPYSLFGLGDMYDFDLVGAQASGRLTATTTSQFNANLSNPASLGYLRYTAFEIGAGFETGGMYEKPTGLTARRNTGGLGYFVLGAPINRAYLVSEDSVRKRKLIQWGGAVALTPHSGVAYKMNSLDSITDIGYVTREQEGRGTHYQLHVAQGWKYKDLSWGLDIAYLFGKTQRYQRDTLGANFIPEGYMTELSRLQNFKQLSFNLGFQYKLVLDKIQSGEEQSHYRRKLKRYVMFGAYSKFGTPYSRKSTDVYRRFKLNSAGDLIASDTVYVSPTTVAKLDAPTTFGGGITFAKEFNWSFGANVEMNLWKGFKNNAGEDEVASYGRFSVGAEWTPKFDSYNSYFKRMTYRMGLLYQTDPRQVSYESAVYKLTRMAVTGGFTLPVYVKRRPSFVNIALEYGKFGNDNLITENYFKATVGFTLNDEGWFIKPKFK